MKLERKYDIQNRAARIYRYTFSKHPIPEPRNGEYIPWLLLNPFQKNVTSYYLPVSDVTIPLITQNDTRNRYAYLSIFNNKKWEAIAFSEIKNGKTTFSEMGRGVIYLPIIYNGEKIAAFNYPFILNSNADVQALSLKQKDKANKLTSNEENALCKMKAAIYRFYSHVKIKDGKYSCSLTNAREINISNQLFSTLQQNLESGNIWIEKCKKEKKEVIIPEIPQVLVKINRMIISTN